MKKILSLFLIIICMMSVPSEVFAAMKSYDISKTKKIAVTENDKVKLKLPSKYKSVKWASSDKNIATVSKNGTLTTKLSGKITVTANSGKSSFKCIVTINEDFSEWILYDTGNFETLLDNLIAGNVVEIDDVYYCSPEYFDMLLNAEVVYENDISESEDYYRGSTLTPDAEFIFKDDKDEYKSEAEALKKRLQDMMKNEKATSE